MVMKPESLVVSAGRPHTPGAPLNTPIVLTAPFLAGGPGGGENRYSRGEPTDTVLALEAALGELEGGTALTFASGMAAITTAIETVVDEMSGGRPRVAVVPSAAYSGSVASFAALETLGRLEIRHVDIADTHAVVQALDGAGLLWLETVSNPLLAVADLPPLIEAAHRNGARVGVDATFSTPLNVRPLELGADIVMHSVTKYLSGHSDVLLGMLATRSEEFAARLLARRTLGGAIPGALESYLALRGLRTLVLRFERAQANALELAPRLAGHPAVTRVRFPGLPDDPGHEVATRVHRGYGAMISFELAGDAEATAAFCSRLHLISDATSLGGVESLIERRAQYAIDAGFGTPPTMLRFSVGIEHVDDLWDDLDTALRG